MDAPMVLLSLMLVTSEGTMIQAGQRTQIVEVVPSIDACMAAAARITASLGYANKPVSIRCDMMMPRPAPKNENPEKPA